MNNTQDKLFKIAEAVRIERARQNLNQTTVASRAKVSIPTYQSVERGKCYKLDSIDKVLNALGLNYDEIV